MNPSEIVDLIISELDSVTQKAEIISKYDFDQVVWFMNGNKIKNGKVISIGGKRIKNGEAEIELEVDVVCGDLCCNFYKNENDCFESRDSLINEILK